MAGDWLQIARVLRPHKAQINSLDFSKDGELLLSSGDDARIALHSTTQGATQRVAICAQQGATHARFTHDPLSVLSASPMDHAIRYMSLHDNKYLKYFNGHEQKVVPIALKTLLIFGRLRW